MLVIVHHRDVEGLLQALFDVEALRRLDIFKVDTTESRCNLLNGFAEFLRIFLVDFDVEYIHATINLEQQSFTFHYWLTAHSADVAESEHSSAITNHSYQVTLVCVLVNFVWVLLNLQAWESYAWWIRQTQVRLCVIRFCWFNLNLTRTACFVIFESRLFCDFYHNNVLV